MDPDGTVASWTAPLGLRDPNLRYFSSALSYEDELALVQGSAKSGDRERGGGTTLSMA